MEKTTDRKRIIITILLVIQFIAGLCILLLFTKRPFLRLLHPQTVEAFLYYVFLFIQPILFFLLYRRKKVGYLLLLLYLSDKVISIPLSILAFSKYSVSPTKEILLSLPFMALSLITFILLLDRRIIKEFSATKSDFIMIFATTLSMVYLNPNIVDAVIPVFSLFKYILIIPATFILLGVVIGSDINLYLKKKLQLDAGQAASKLFITKMIMTVIPFLLLIPFQYFILTPLLGRGVHLADGLGEYHPDKNKFYDLLECIYFLFPAIVTFLWFQISIIKKNHLRQIANNYFWTVFLLYLSFFSYLTIINFKNIHF